MKDVCVTPLWQRPEYLKVWIDVIKKANNADKVLYLFCLDYGHDDKNHQILKDFPFEKIIVEAPHKNLKLGKQSHNVLTGLIKGASIAKELVYYVEEDIMIARDFFDVHKAIHEKETGIYCSIATRSNNTQWDTTNDLNAYYKSDLLDFQSLGTCYKKEVIANLVEPHFVEEYFIDPIGYCAVNFPNSTIGGHFTEQDGLQRRIIESNKLSTAFPHVPRAYHAGLYGYNRQSKYASLSYESKLNLIKEVIFDNAKMREHSINEHYYNDSMPVNLDTNFKKMILRNVEVKAI